jgi:endoglycosylceramidase
MRALRTAALAALLSACGSDAGSPPLPPPYRVERGAIVDASGRTVVLRGVNLASAHKQRPYLSDFGASDYRRLRDEYGFTVLRYLVSWAGIEPQRGIYDEGYLDEVARRIGWARDAGLVVVLDMHQDLFGEGFAGGDGAPRWACDESRYAAFRPQSPWFLGYLDPNVSACVDALYAEDGELRGRYVEAWRHLAARLRGNDAVIGFDPINEPHWGTSNIFAFEEEKLAPFYLAVARAVRDEAPTWLLFAEPSASRNVGYGTRLPPLPIEGVVYAPHAYDRDAESGNGFDPARRVAMLENVRKLRAEADLLGAALFIGEYGGDADAPGIAPYMDALYDGIGLAAAGSAYWAFDKDDGYGLLSREGSEKKLLADVLARPYPSRVAGTLLSYEIDDAIGAASIRYAPDPSIETPTEILVPPRAYPRGFDVECAGCENEAKEGLVRITRAAAGDAVVVTLRPR